MMTMLLIVGMLALAWNSQLVRASPNILVVNHEETRFWYMNYALNQLGLPHSSVRISELTAMTLTNYDIVLIGSLIGLLDEVKPCLDVKASEIETWVTLGGSLGVFCQFVGAGGYDLNGNMGPVYGSGYYEWMPGNPSFTSISSDSAHITNQAHPITQGLTDADLSGWGTCPDGYFASFPGEGLIVQAGYSDRVVLYAQTLGSGKIVGASPDVDYHFWFNARGQEGINDAKAFLQNIINWLTPASPPPPPPVPEFPLGSAMPLAMVPLLFYLWWKRKQKTP
jgi:hypothetical protein